MERAVKFLKEVMTKRISGIHIELQIWFECYVILARGKKLQRNLPHFYAKHKTWFSKKNENFLENRVNHQNPRQFTDG